MKSSKRHRHAPDDPHAAREAEKYVNPIPSREYIIERLTAIGEPSTQADIARDLGLTEPDDLEALRRRLRAMERDGQVFCNRRSAYGVIERMDLQAGRVMGHPDGFGFLIPDDGAEDIYLSSRQMRSLLHGDRAVVRKVGVDRRGRTEGAVVEVLERANTEVVGRYFRDGDVGYVVPDNKRIHQDILIPNADAGAASHGQMVVCTLVAQPDKHRQPVGRIAEILGDHMAPGMEIDVAIRTHQIPREWPDDVLQEIANLSPTVPKKALAGRLDLRALPFVTIDGEDARDFDDAVYCEKFERGWKLYVAIADVGHYVQPHTALDREATARGNSVYFPNRVIPMLPEELSNGLCSLNPRVDRLCMVCEMILGARGKVQSYTFHEAVIKSAARLTYTEVHAMVAEKDEPVRQKYKELLAALDNLYKLYGVFKTRREQRGAIDFDTTETRIIFGDDKKIKAIVPTIRNDAHRLIEEFMVAANVAAAEFLRRHKCPALYRVHEAPNTTKLEDLRTFLGELGLSLGGGDKPSAKDYAHLLASLSGRDDAHLVQTVLLRSLRLAVYSPENVGHFGLAFAAYTHFTSPIRRYPDLLVHRAIRHILRSGSAANFMYDRQSMRQLGEGCSMTERRADEATRDAVAWLKCEFMLDKVGDEFDGVISAVTSFGLFVELRDIYVEGLVHVTSLNNDYYHYDPVGHRLRGERSGVVYRLAGAVKVRVLRVNLDDRKIDFEVVAQASANQRKKKRRR